MESNCFSIVKELCLNFAKLCFQTKINSNDFWIHRATFKNLASILYLLHINLLLQKDAPVFQMKQSSFLYLKNYSRSFRHPFSNISKNTTTMYCTINLVIIFKNNIRMAEHMYEKERTIDVYAWTINDKCWIYRQILV